MKISIQQRTPDQEVANSRGSSSFLILHLFEIKSTVTKLKSLTSDPGITAAALCQDFPKQVVAGAAPMVVAPLHGLPQSLTTRLAGMGMAHHTRSRRGYPCSSNSKEVWGKTSKQIPRGVKSPASLLGNHIQSGYPVSGCHCTSMKTSQQQAKAQLSLTVFPPSCSHCLLK